MSIRFEAILLAVGLIWSSAAAATAQDKCPQIRLVADEFLYGSPTSTIGPALPELQRRFDEALLDVCKIVNEPLEWRPSDELHLLNSEANQLGIYMTEDEQSAVAEYPFEIEDGVLFDLPPTEEFRRAIICASDKAEQFGLDPSDCLPD